MLVVLSVAVKSKSEVYISGGNDIYFRQFELSIGGIQGEVPCIPLTQSVFGTLRGSGFGKIKHKMEDAMLLSYDMNRKIDV